MSQKLKIRMIFILSIFILLSSFGYAGEASRFSTLTEAFNSLRDYTIENGTFKIIDKKRPHIQLHTTVFANDTPEGIEAKTRRALIYGIYRSFIHTKVDQIEVTVIPQQLNPKTSKRKTLSTYKRNIFVERQKALKIIKLYLAISRFDQLVTDMKFGKSTISDVWAKNFESIYYNRNRTIVWLDKLAR